MAYFPQYPPHNDLPDQDIRTFITNFYHASDKAEAGELWVSYFTKDAEVVIGSAAGQGAEGIREVRGRLWDGIHSRKHVVAKVFPAIFSDQQQHHHQKQPDSSSSREVEECELMMFGHVNDTTRDGRTVSSPWAGHGVVRRVREGERQEWKFSRYQTWIQAP